MGRESKPTVYTKILDPSLLRLLQPTWCVKWDKKSVTCMCRNIVTGVLCLMAKHTLMNMMVSVWNYLKLDNLDLSVH